MKKNVLIIVFLFLSIFSAVAQIEFDKGYFIDANDQRVDCYIRNLHWTKNPSKFDYKMAPDGEVQVADITMVKEFGVEGQYKFVAHTVKIDWSSSKLGTLSSQREPVFEEDKLFLRCLVEGRASLLMYQSVNLVRYFYQKDASPVQQLVYKQYKVETRVVYNYEFRQQLAKQLECASLSTEDIIHVKYETKDLRELFVKYNECQNTTYYSFDPNAPRAKFNLSLRPGLNYTNLEVIHSEHPYSRTEFDSEFGFRMGLEAEFVLPVHRNKWSLLLEPTYQRYKAETPNPEGGSPLAKVDYRSIEWAFGLRRYFHLKDKSTLFANASFVLDYALESSYERLIRGYDNYYNPLKIRSGGCWAFGAGYKFANRYSVEVRYYSSRDIHRDYWTWGSHFQPISLIFGWTLF